MTLLTIKEVAKILRLAESTVYQMVSKGKITGFRIGPTHGGIRVSQSDLDLYLASCKMEEKDEKPPKVSRPRLKHIKI